MGKLFPLYQPPGRGNKQFASELAELTGDSKRERKNLEPAEFCYAMHRRKVLYEAEYGKAKAIGARAANASMNRGDANATIAFASFSAKAAELSGKSERLTCPQSRIISARCIPGQPARPISPNSPRPGRNFLPLTH